jgi:hypothetical protein
MQVVISNVFLSERHSTGSTGMNAHQNYLTNRPFRLTRERRSKTENDNDNLR